MTQPRWFWLAEADWARATKREDTLTTVVFFDPLVRVILPLVLRAGVSPNQVTIARLAVAFWGMWAFMTGDMFSGGLSFLIWYASDCIDGKVARLTGRTSAFGDWLDRMTDRVGVGAMLIALGGRLAADGEMAGGMLAIVLMTVWFLDCMNGDRLVWLSKQWSGGEKKGEAKAEGGAEKGAGAAASGGGLMSKIKWWRREFTGRTRVTFWLVDNVEWLMLGLVVGPWTGATTLCGAIAVGAMGARALLLTAVFWMARRDRMTEKGGMEAQGRETAKREAPARKAVVSEKVGAA